MNRRRVRVERSEAKRQVEGGVVRRTTVRTNELLELAGECPCVATGYLYDI